MLDVAAVSGSAALEVVLDHDILDVDVPRLVDRLPHCLRHVLRPQHLVPVVPWVIKGVNRNSGIFQSQYLEISRVKALRILRH